MLLWFLALVLLASLAGLGYRQGVVRVAFAFVGIVFGALLAGPLAKLIKPLLVICGLKTPPLAWLLAPVVAFLLVSIIFKIAGFMVHQKVDVHFRYHAGDLRQALWERLSRRLGLCLGLANGAVYLILLAAVIYPMSYVTFQLKADDQDPRLMRIVNRLGQDFQSTGFVKVARALDPMPQVWYDSADLAGLIYNNPLTQARLARYPAFLGLAERQEFQDMSSDTQFTELLMQKAPIMKVFDHPKVQAIVNNRDLLQLVWATVVPDLKDLPVFLDTRKSPKYDSERILGRWTFNANFALSLFRKAKPNISSKEMLTWKRWMVLTFAKTSFVAMTDHQAILKNVPPLRLPAPGAASAATLHTLKGEWKDSGSKYELSLSGGSRDEQATAVVEGDRLTITGEGLSLVFDRED